MTKSKEYIEGFIDALKQFAWLDNKKNYRVGMYGGGMLLKDAIEKIEAKKEPEVVIKPEPEKIVEEAPPKKTKKYE